ncbi:MAG: hypothetical protein HY247_04300 [archaeon]|nr:MAG: hypothetical protein HY247_04300 [archaeon]
MIQGELDAITSRFWEMRHERRDVEAYERYLDIFRLHSDGKSDAQVGRMLHMNNVGKYLKGQKRPFLATMASWAERLGQPREGWQWLPLSLRPRGTPGDEWIQVPTEVRYFRDISNVLNQLRPKDVSPEELSDFGFSSRSGMENEKALLFGFFLGATIGDAGKHTKGESHFESKSISLMLSMAKPNSLRFGEFATLSVRASLGLAMHRIADSPMSTGRYSKAACFQWLTPSSPLLAWVFHVCLGLKKGELTTYDALRMPWLLNSPARFKVAVLQGVCESDGWVDAAADTACFVSSPNTTLFSRLLERLNTPYRVDRQKLVEVTRIPTSYAAGLCLFNSRIRSVYYRQLSCMSKATRLPERVRLRSEVVGWIQELAAHNGRISEICLALATKYHIKVAGNTVRRYTQFL